LGGDQGGEDQAVRFHGVLSRPGWAAIAFRLIRFISLGRRANFGQNTRFIELAGEINTAMPMHVVNRTAEALNARANR
jgi:UDP-N-acetyl-D-glucosamine dehydrogenase